MPMPDFLTRQEVSDAIADLKVCIEDTKQDGIFSNLVEIYLPRLAHILTENKVLSWMVSELPETGHEDFFRLVAKGLATNADNIFPVDAKARLSLQIAILIRTGNGRIDLWDFADTFFGQNNGGKFWTEIFSPATRDFLRYVISRQKSIAEQNDMKQTGQSPRKNAVKSYTLDLFISHSSKDKRVAKALIDFLRAALAIPHDRVRCTSVDGYKLSAGAKTENALQNEIQNAICFIGLITPDSMKSQFVLFELGARWGSDEHLVPLLANGMTAGSLRPPLSSLNALSCASKGEMEQLVHDLANVLKKNVPLPTVYQYQLRALLKLQSEKK
jgi:hypothetical protein